ncbi:F-box protein At5g49610-like [Papaver somniferum]|uniref:F-box protein At5g49610-like n=1 Tax=Papaver somniferum TaxID=3469 RepID=UPI000E6F5CA4|nr:F-box protein At5g49610-like [Papaver somniferum]XP_026394154.1 F-box protein At5g49610-like [Papaver somniferum]
MELKKGFTKVEDEENEVVAPEVRKLSSDAIYEILIRASFSTLLCQSQWVCKDWQKLIICDSKFQQTHSQRIIASGHFFEVISSTGRNSVIFVRSNNDHEELYNSAQEVQSPSLDFLPTGKSITIAGSSLHGSLLCCFTNSSSTPIPSFYMCKPASREWRKIPNPKTTLKSFGIGIAVKLSSCSILHYKILRLSQSKTGLGYHCQLFNSERWAWKTLLFVQFKRDYTYLIGEDGIWVNGGLH